MSLKRESVSVESLPNSSLLAEIVKESELIFKGETMTDIYVTTVKHFINEKVNMCIETGLWRTRGIYNDRFIKYNRIEVLRSDSDPNALKVIPVWEY
jgi:hypothetical protein